MSVVVLFCALQRMPASSPACQSGPMVSDNVRTLSVSVYFRQGKIEFDPDYYSNGERLEAFAAELNDYLENPANLVENLHIYGTASPEGTMLINDNLSKARATLLTKFITSMTPISPHNIKVEPVTVNWGGLSSALDTCGQPWAGAVKRLLRETPEVGSVDGTLSGRRRALMAFKGGVAWNWLSDNVFPSLRLAEFRITFRQPKASEVREMASRVDTLHISRVDTVYMSRVDTLYIREDHYYHTCDTVYVDSGRGSGVSSAVKRRTPDGVKPKDESSVSQEKYRDPEKKLILAVRSNLLVPLMNIGLEVPIGNRWSMGVDHYSPWVWRNIDVNRICFEFMFDTVEARYWFGKGHRSGTENECNRLLGHSLGLFGCGGYFDFEKDWSGHQGEFFGGGIDYMYALPVYKNRIYMEFELGVGYMRILTRPYKVYTTGGKLFHDREEGDRAINYFGPLRAEVNFVIPIYAKRKAKKSE